MILKPLNFLSIGMKNKPFLFLIILLGTLGCERETAVVPAINLIRSSTCKSHEVKASDYQSPETDCVQCSWVAGDTLHIKHINAGFNCCPEGFNTSLKVSGDTLVITESEHSSLCDCCCLFDLEFDLTGITRKSWWIRVEEPYRKPTDDRVIFNINLSEITQKEVCFVRTGYPWGY